MHCLQTKNLSLLLVVLLVLGGCEDESLVDVGAGEDALFDRYVAIGNSITAGFQSGGINAETQQESYVVLLAEQMGTPFRVPLLKLPGCPPPLQNALTGERIENIPSGCALRATPVPETINNVAVPGSEVVDVLNNQAEDSNANALTTFLLGGRTQLDAALDADPTFVSVWTGNNDVLGAALAGDTGAVTPADSFRSRYTRILDALRDGGVRGGVLIGVADVTLVPALQPGAFYMSLAHDSTARQALPDNFNVANTCAPQASGRRLVSFSFVGNLIQQATEDSDQTVTLDCAGKAGTLTQQEIGALTEAVDSYNQFIRSQADERGYAFVNPNDLFEARQGSIPSCTPTQQGFEGCPDFTGANPFGPLFSLDGVHPTARAHELIAATVAQAINAQYGTRLGAPNDVPVDDQ